jgi:tripeptidyl-peptidase-1
MVQLGQLLNAAFVAQVVTSSPLLSSTSIKVKERHLIPRNWRHIARAPESQTIKLKIGVKQGRFEELERQLYEGKDLW